MEQILFDEITIHDPRIDEQQDALRYQRQNVEQLKEHHVALCKSINNCLSAEAILAEIAAEALERIEEEIDSETPGTHIVRSRLETLNDPVAAERGKMEYTQEHIARRIRERTQSMAYAHEELERLSHLSENKTIRQEDLEAALLPFDEIDPDTIAIWHESRERNDICISWVFSGLTMTPDRNPYSYIQDGARPHIPLADVLVHLYPKTGNIALKFADKKQQDDYPGFYMGVKNGAPRVHPHVLSGDEPCLGNFKTAITEALHEHDWATVAGILKMYLETAADSDEAGRGWVHAINDKYFYNFFDFEFEQERDEEGDETGDYENVRFDIFEVYNRDGQRHLESIEFWQNPRDLRQWLVFDAGEGHEAILQIETEMDAEAVEPAADLDVVEVA